jgi:hypothetical protein
VFAPQPKAAEFSFFRHAEARITPDSALARRLGPAIAAMQDIAEFLT